MHASFTLIQMIVSRYLQLGNIYRQLQFERTTSAVLAENNPLRLKSSFAIAR